MIQKKNKAEYSKRGYLYGDKRLETRGKQIRSSIFSKESLIINQIDTDWAFRVGAYRFFKNPKVSEESVLEQSLKLQVKPPEQEELYVISDTSQINLNHLQSRVKDKSRLGVLNDGLTLGYNLHGSIVLNSKFTSCLVSDAIIYKRAFPGSEESKRIRSTKRDDLPMEEKESYRWLLGAKKSTEYLGKAQRLNFIFDREGDIYRLLDEIEKQGSKFVVRSQHNRQIELEDGRMVKVSEYLDQQPVNFTYFAKVSADSRGNKTRIVELELKYAKVRIKAPRHYSFKTSDSENIEVTIVQSKEKLERGQAKPPNYIKWDILTNREVLNKCDSKKIIEIYSNRWCIEDVFRGMKNKGLQLDSVELETGQALRKIGIMAFDVSTVALRLRQARDGETFSSIHEVFNDKQVECLEQLCLTLEGNTDKQKNLHAPKSLAWAAWVIARLGGWSGYDSQRPPGIITMEKGIERFSSLFLGWSIRIP